jgi:hypothetical protein
MKSQDDTILLTPWYEWLQTSRYASVREAHDSTLMVDDEAQKKGFLM